MEDSTPTTTTSAAAIASAAAAVATLERPVSQQSVLSTTRSHRSRTSSTPRARKRLTSYPSSCSASSIAPSDKSLTSFPSFSPESPRQELSFFELNPSAFSPSISPSRNSRKSSDPISVADSVSNDSDPHQTPEAPRPQRIRPASIVQSLITAEPEPDTRDALFQDVPITANKIPGSLHHADNAHIERLIARHGAVNLVRQISQDLAERDAQIATLRRRADDRERALRKIILECGLSTLDLETRLRAIGQDAKHTSLARKVTIDGGLSDLMNEAMAHDLRAVGTSTGLNDATIRATTMSVPPAADTETTKGTTKGWRDLLWGTGTTGKNSGRPSSVTSGGTGTGSSARDTSKTVIRGSERRLTLADDPFNPPETDSTDSVRSSSRASSINSAKSSLASLALRLVAGGATTGRNGDMRGRANTARQPGGSLRTPSTSSRAASSVSNRTVSAAAQAGPRSLMAMRRPTGPAKPIDVPQRYQQQDRWDTMGSSPSRDLVSRQQSYGPVEMDTILPPEVQPPTLTHIYNNHLGSEFLTDRFGFIYDQRRKKRQREAARMARHARKPSRTEMLSTGRNRLSPVMLDESSGGRGDTANEAGPESPSAEEQRDDSKPRKWQDYLKIATFPTELLSHTPLITVPGFEVMEGGEVPEAPRSPGLITSEERGFVPSATPAIAAIALPENEDQPSPDEGEQQSSSGNMAKEDAEPVRLLLQNLNQLHDTLQREKTVRWNDFLRKVRAERKRDGEAAAAAAAAAAEARFQRAEAVMPETRLGDGELIGVASLGIQGKVGRAKANEFRQLILGGIPVAYRAKIWSECCGAKALRIPGYYDDLVNRPEDQDDPQVVAQIKADITRTLTDNIFFRKGPGVEKLNEVLLAYARRNPDVGYCQGMNLVVANLLLITPCAEDAFWILVSIVENILPPNYFDHSLLASRADQQVLRQYVSEVLPKLSAHFEELGITLETMTFQWFLSVFTDCLSAEALFRVWDVLLCTHDGGVFLFQVALALLKLNERQLLACDSAAHIYSYINHEMTNHAISIDGLIQASEALRRVVQRDEVEARRANAVEAEKEMSLAREKRREEMQQQIKKLAEVQAQKTVGAPAVADSGVTSVDVASGDLHKPTVGADDGMTGTI
ncbi:rab-GTPase-TBC domain-containing protein [Pseudoneurospora amorphoporcata]|uniref:Rab-GTPase-TBC domain-containing protein n=1 Tax=Pseudoneurospora amorphoporcata TaxID=241081 RepID=A0AAN6SB65_9PEZI|nr:rab-GTPase-TBC domain-containing protein [Pseudoneurospora amorphoporcata]